ncbi:MAG: hypothetical protein ACP5T3_00680 [Candidatus Micrarchaeia archaeon]
MLEKERKKLLDYASRKADIDGILKALNTYNRNYKETLEKVQRLKRTNPRVISSRSTLPDDC